MLPPNNEIRKKIEKMIDELETNPAAGEQLQKRLWPKDYTRQGLENVFRFEIDKSMRATYTVRRIDNQNREVRIIDFFRTHKEYERKFHY
jgi:Txe/YoeB family toxin of Txe-Axe toxin-antitoxin module